MWAFLLLLSPIFMSILFIKFFEHREKNKEDSDAIIIFIIFVAILVIIGQISS